jgi:hypothetical protein
MMASGEDLSCAKEMFKKTFKCWIATVNENCDVKEVLKNIG